MIKNNSKGYVKAFSIVEAAFSMVITAIVIGLVFIIFSILSERMLDFKNQNQYVADMNRLTYALNKDIFDNERMYSDGTGILFNSYSGKSTQYRCTAEYTVRAKDGFVDTFKIPFKQCILDTVKNKKHTIVFQQLKIKVTVNKQPFDLNFYKKVYANQLIGKLK